MKKKIVVALILSLIITMGFAMSLSANDNNLLSQEHHNLIQSAFDSIAMPVIPFSVDDCLDSIAREFFMLSRDLIAPVDVVLRDIIYTLDFTSDVNIVFDNVFEHFFLEDIYISIVVQYGIMITSDIGFSICFSTMFPHMFMLDMDTYDSDLVVLCEDEYAEDKSTHGRFIECDKLVTWML